VNTPETKPAVALDEPSGEVRILDPASVRLFRNEAGVPQMEVAGEFTCLRVQVKCSFPLSKPHEYVSFRDGANREVGLIENLKDLDHDTRRIVEEEIERRYFLPEITAIYSINGHFGSYEWDVETDRGRRSFHVRGRSENIVKSLPNRVLITDVLGNRYKVSDYTKLDRASYAQIYKVI